MRIVIIEGNLFISSSTRSVCAGSLNCLQAFTREKKTIESGFLLDFCSVLKIEKAWVRFCCSLCMMCSAEMRQEAPIGSGCKLNRFHFTQLGYFNARSPFLNCFLVVASYYPKSRISAFIAIFKFL